MVRNLRHSNITPLLTIDNQLKECNLKWAEKTVCKILIRFVPKTTDYDVDDSANTFSLYLNLNSSPEVIIKYRKQEYREDVLEKEVSKEGQVRQTVKKLRIGDAEPYLKWYTQLGQVITGKPYDTNKAKFEIVQIILYRDPKDTCQEISESVRKSEVTKDKVNKDETQDLCDSR